MNTVLDDPVEDERLRPAPYESSSPPLEDPAVPGVRLVTDTGALTDLLQRAGEQLVSRPYLRWKPGTSCVAGLRLASGPAFAVAVGDAGHQKLEKTVQQAPAGTLVLFDPTTRIVVARAGADRDLPGLRTLTATLQRRLEAPPVSVRTLAYKPQRRFVGQCRTGSAETSFVVRAYRLAEAGRAYRTLRRARRLLGDLVPEPVDRHAELGLVIQRWSPGEGLSEALTRPGADELLSDVGRHLAEVHSHHARQAPPRRAGAEPAATARLLGALDNELGGWAADLAQRLVSRRPDQQRPVLVHGDFSADQIVVGAGGGLRILDWDRAGTGPAGVDLAGLRAAGLAPHWWSVVVEGYSRVRRLPRHLDWYVAAALFERAPEAFRQGRHTWRPQTRDRLAQVEALLK